MSIIVKKFGGTSVGTLERIEAVCTQLIEAYQQDEKLVVVVSAMSGETDRLLKMAYQLCPNPAPRELDVLITSGEHVSMSLLAMSLCQKGIPAKSYNAAQLDIRTNNQHNNACIVSIQTQKIIQALEHHQIVIVAGFQGLSQQGDVTSLGRGGSDTSAVALAAALNAKECHIFTDVDGIYTADPRIAPKAYRLDTIHGKAMLELASFGSKVLQWRSVALACKYQMPLRVLSSFKKGPGTFMHYHDEALETAKLSGLSHQLHLKRWLITIKNPEGDEALILSQNLAQEGIRFEHINQMHSEHGLQISLLFNAEEQNRAETFLQHFCTTKNWQYQMEGGLARIALIGIGLKAYPVIINEFLKSIKGLTIPIKDVSFSETSLSVILFETDVSKTVQKLHQTFFENYV